MAPRKSKEQSKKRKAGSSSTTRRTVFDPHRFRGPKQFERFQELENRTICPERIFEISDVGNFSRFAEIIDNRHWGKLTNPTKKINFDLVREFYANAIPLDNEDPVTFRTYVRGNEIKFDRDTINSFLGNPSSLPPDTYCALTQHLARENWNVPAITQTLLRPGHAIEWSKDNAHPLRALRDDLTIPSQLLQTFSLHNVIPRTHTSDATMRVLTFMYYMEKNLEIDVARLIANEMKDIILSGIRVTRLKPNSTLGFPGLIMGLIKDQAQTSLPHESHLTLKEYTDKDAKTNCKYRKTTVFVDQAGGQSSVPPPTAPPVSPPSGYPPMDPTTFHNLVSYNWDLHDAGFRAMQAVHQSIFNSQMQQPIMTPESFLNHVQWPGVRPYIPGGSSSAAADGGDNVAGDDVAGDDVHGDDADDSLDQQLADAFMDEDNDGDDDDAASDEAVDEDSMSDDF
jgi:hypothetical protein